MWLICLLIRELNVLQVIIAQRGVMTPLLAEMELIVQINEAPRKTTVDHAQSAPHVLLPAQWQNIAQRVAIAPMQARKSSAP